jgi:MFS family permease
MNQNAGVARYLGLDLQSGMRRTFINTWLLSNLALVMLASYQPQMQPYLLTEFLHEPVERHGRISGMLNFWQEILIIVVVALVGPLSDKIGRKPLMAGGFFIMAGAFALLPHATTVGELLGYRLIFGVGVACVTVQVVTLLADYVANRSRGKAAGFQGVMNGIGAMIAVFLLMRLPAIFQRGGSSAVEAGFQTYYLVAGVSALIGIAMVFGLKGGRPRAAVESRQSFGELARAGFGAARDLRIALAYGGAFLSRGNLTIVGTFLALWGANYGTETLGLARSEAMARAGMLMGIAQSVALLSAPLFGLMADRIDRVKALGIAMAFSAIGYGGTFFVDNPYGGLMIGLAIFIGLGEVGCIITSGVLIAQQSPEHNRGAVIGTFNMCGAIGILAANVVGGWLFDHWREPGPFVAFGLLALLMMVAAFTLARHERRRPPG